jgi:glycosyltransferase involved in cell wall biosynthesis
LLAADESRQALGLRHQSYIYGNVGRLHPDKDQTTLIRAFARVQPADALLAIAGSGRLDPSLKALANDLGVAQRVVFLGQVPGMSRYFGAFDSFVLTSDHEPFGMVLLEAMAARLPVMASDCGGAKEVVSNREWRFPLGDVDALADRMQRMRALDAGARADLVAAQLADLRERFSLDAGRRQFWSQPFVRTWIGSDGTN